jgi:hypothetical protein
VPCVLGQSANTAVTTIRRSEDLAHSTALYRDCKALEGATVNTDRIRDSWAKSYESVRKYLRENDAESLKHAFTIEGTLTSGQFTTVVNVNEALNNLNRSTVMVTQESSPSYSYEGSTAAIIMTTGLMRHICNTLLPNDLFQTLKEEVTRAGTKAEDSKHAAEESQKLAARFLLIGIRYSGVKIFVLGHEASHLLLDRYSGDLVGGKGYQGNSGCAATFYLETRADIVGVSALRRIPLSDKVDDALRDELGDFPPETATNMDKVAIRYGVSDLLGIVEKERDWQPSADSCAKNAQQRRGELEHALDNFDKKANPQ